MDDTLLLIQGVSLAQLSAKAASEHHNTTSGFIAVLSAACTSGKQYGIDLILFYYFKDCFYNC